MLKSILDTHNVVIRICEPTRITSHSSTCNDNIFTNISEGVTTVSQPHLSDHAAQTFRLSVNMDNHTYTRMQNIRIYSENALMKFESIIMKINWDEIYSYKTCQINEMWEYFFQQIKQAFEECFPFTEASKNRSTKNTVMNDPNIKLLKNQLDIYYLISRYNANTVEMYKKLKRQYDLTISKTKQAYYAEKINKSDNKSKSTWHIVNTLLNKSSAQSKMLVPSGDPEETADRFNNYFINAAPDLCKMLPVSNEGVNMQYLENSFYVFEVTTTEIENVVKHLKNTTTCGHDGIPNKIIKRSIKYIAEPLRYIINMSFIEGIFPDKLKIAIIKPIYKKGPIDEPDSYRPISILSSFSKIFEKLLANRLLSFFKKFQVFNENQHGFLPSRGTETAILELTQSILIALEKGEIPIALFLDLSKAFDCVEHERLLTKLNYCGIRNKQLDLLKSYLKNRVQYVKIGTDDGYISKYLNTSMGVPQGSILGPLLFILYINDLPRVLPHNANTTIYADDTNIVITATNEAAAMQDCKHSFKVVKNWCNQNRLIINVNKTDCIFFQTDRSVRRAPRSLTLEDIELPMASSAKFLGVYLDCKLKFKEHIDYLTRRLCSVVFSLNVMKHHVDIDTLMVIYFSNFQSLLSYGVIFWGSSSQWNRVFVIQKLALRTIYRMKLRDSCRGLFRTKKILTLNGLFIYKSLLFLHKHEKCYENYKSGNKTRRMEPFLYPRHKLSLLENSAMYMSMKLFNALPRRFQMIPDFRKFKKLIFDLLIRCEPYNTTEFFEYCKREM
ncbi:hypothetical protein WA026_004648 [Henosepilachna vigintioctopunctata]|uniref:Reverse transcriptase domain-containing protein n=2 Tax=Henosepilachna vigintioctopunctata TaxID=420089 RepID=A0AAW1V9G3_9CUCU